MFVGHKDITVQAFSCPRAVKCNLITTFLVMQKLHFRKHASFFFFFFKHIHKLICSKPSQSVTISLFAFVTSDSFSYIRSLNKFCCYQQFSCICESESERQSERQSERERER